MRISKHVLRILELALPSNIKIRASNLLDVFFIASVLYADGSMSPSAQSLSNAKRCKRIFRIDLSSKKGSLEKYVRNP
jgi:hypothetical protein